LVTQKDIHSQILYLEQISNAISEHIDSAMTPLEIEQLISNLLNSMRFEKYIANHCETRLRSGLFELFMRKNKPDVQGIQHMSD